MSEKFSATMLPITQVHPYPGNPRKNVGAVAKVAASIQEFGFRQPIVVDEAGVIIAGHTRLLAALHLGLARVPVHVAQGLTPAQVKAYRLADNRVGQEATWDEELLALEMSDLRGLDYDLAITGFSEGELAALLTPATTGLVPGTDRDAAPPLPSEPLTKIGDLIQLGPHRLICGDSTEAHVVDRVLWGEHPTMMVTDPPYGVNLDQSWRDKALGDKAMGPGNRNIVANDDRADWSEVWSLFTGDIAYVWHASKFADVVMASLRSCDFEICQQLIWNKSIMVMGRSDYHFKHEPCWYAVRKGRAHRWCGDRTQVTVIDAKSPNHIMSGSTEVKTDHPTQKPVDCMTYVIKNHDGDVYDPFLGSGTTLIAAEIERRRCFGVELSPAYCDVIVTRWEQATGQKAVRP